MRSACRRKSTTALGTACLLVDASRQRHSECINALSITVDSGSERVKFVLHFQKKFFFVPFFFFFLNSDCEIHARGGRETEIKKRCGLTARCVISRWWW